MLRAFANGIYFTAEPTTNVCAGCCFDNERSSVCRMAGNAAIEDGLPDCEQGFIYVADPSEGRQADLLIAANPQKA